MIHNESMFQWCSRNEEESALSVIFISGTENAGDEQWLQSETMLLLPESFVEICVQDRDATHKDWIGICRDSIIPGTSFNESYFPLEEQAKQNECIHDEVERMGTLPIISKGQAQVKAGMNCEHELITGNELCLRLNAVITQPDTASETNKNCFDEDEAEISFTESAFAPVAEQEFFDEEQIEFERVFLGENEVQGSLSSRLKSQVNDDEDLIYLEREHHLEANEIRKGLRAMASQPTTSSQADEHCFDEEEAEMISTDEIDLASDITEISFEGSAFAAGAEQERFDEGQTEFERDFHDDHESKGSLLSRLNPQINDKEDYHLEIEHHRGANEIREGRGTKAAQPTTSSETDEHCFDEKEADMISTEARDYVSDESEISFSGSAFAPVTELEEQSEFELIAENDYIFEAFTLLDLSVHLSVSSNSSSQTYEYHKEAALDDDIEEEQLVASETVNSSLECTEQKCSLSHACSNDPTEIRRRLGVDGRHSSKNTALSKNLHKAATQFETIFPLHMVCFREEMRTFNHMVELTDADAAPDESFPVAHENSLRGHSVEPSLFTEAPMQSRVAETVATKGYARGIYASSKKGHDETAATLNRKDKNVSPLSSRSEPDDSSTNIGEGCLDFSECLDQAKMTSEALTISTPSYAKKHIGYKAGGTPDTYELSFTSSLEDDELFLFEALHEVVIGESKNQTWHDAAIKSISTLGRRSVTLLTISFQTIIVGVLLVGLLLLLREDRGLRNPAGIY